VGLTFSGIVAALTFGVAVGNVLQGVPFHFSESLRPFYTGSFFALFNPFALLCGLISVAMLLMHGACYLIVKTDHAIRERAIKIARSMALLLIALFALAGYFITAHIKGYLLTAAINHAGPSNPLYKTVALQAGQWVQNYQLHPIWLTAPMLSFIGAIGVILLARAGSGKVTLLLSGFSIAGIISTVGLSMFPFILPSSSNPNQSLMVWDASASDLSLSIMLICAIIFLPIILAYTTWVYRILRGKITKEYIQDNQDSVY
jgi:cytochrome bd ubiquinol oxidase subunit II